MGCDHIKVPGGGAAIVCTRAVRRHKCCACHLAGGFQCDWKLSETKTCDRFICPEHALKVAPNKHLCPEHQETYKAWQAKRKERAAT